MLFSFLNILGDFKFDLCNTNVMSTSMHKHTKGYKLDTIKLLIASSDFAYVLFLYCSALLSLISLF